MKLASNCEKIHTTNIQVVFDMQITSYKFSAYKTVPPQSPSISTYITYLLTATFQANPG